MSRPPFVKTDPLEAAVAALDALPEDIWPEVLRLTSTRREVAAQEAALRELLGGKGKAAEAEALLQLGLEEDARRLLGGER